MSHPDPIARETAIHAATTAALSALAALPDDAARDEARRRLGACVLGAAMPEPQPEADAVVSLPYGMPPTLDALRASLTRHAGNLAAVGREYGKARGQVHRWLRRYGIDAADYR